MLLKRQSISFLSHLEITTIYVLTALLGKYLSGGDIYSTPLGLEFGVSLAAFLIHGYRVAPPIFFAAALSSISSELSAWSIFFVSLVNVLVPGFVRWGMMHFELFNNNLEHGKSVFTLLLWGLLLGASLYSLLHLVSAGVISIDSSQAFLTAFNVWMWSSIGVLLLVPPILIFHATRRRSFKHDQRQIALLFSIFICCFIVFTNYVVPEALRLVFSPYVFYPLIVCGALYVGLNTVYLGIFMIFIFAYTSHLLGVGFYGENKYGIDIGIWSFIVSLVITGLAIGISRVRREQAEWKASSSRMDDLLSNHNLSLEALMTSQCEEAVGDIKGCYASVFLKDNWGNFEMSASHMLPDDFREAFSENNFQTLDTPIKRAIDSGRLTSSDLNPSKWLHISDLVKPWGGCHCFPILNLFRKPIGVLCLFYVSPTRFQLAEIERLQRVAYQCSLLVVRKRAEIALNEKNRQVENEQAILRNVIDTNPDVLFMKDVDGRFTLCNSAFRQFSGKTDTVIVGKTSDEIFANSIDPAIFDMDTKIISGKAEFLREEFWLKNSQNQNVLFDLVKAPMKNVEGRIVGVISIGRDITQQREIEAELVAMTEDQQRVIGQELHDGVGQKLVGATFIAKVLEQQLRAKNSESSESASILVARLNEIISEIRSLARGLLPIELEANGLNVALESLANNVSDTFGVRCLYHANGRVLIDDHIISLNLYRIVQEAVNNAIKHGKASAIDIEINTTQDNFTLTVQDNGEGFDYQQYNQENTLHGVGLQSMLYRASLIRAKIIFDRPYTGGMIVRIVG